HNQATRDALMKSLQELGYDVQLAYDGHQMWERIQAEHFALVVMSATLPPAGCHELLEQIRADVHFQALPIITVAASDAPAQEAVEAIKSGADDYIFAQMALDPMLLGLRIDVVMERRRGQDVQQANLEKAEKLARKIEEIVLPMGIALSSESNFDRLLERILMGAKQVTNADAGTLYMRTPENTLRFEIAMSDSLNMFVGGTTGKPVPFSPLPLYDSATGEPTHHNVATHVAHTGRSVNIPDIYTAEGFDFTGTKIFDKQNNYRSKSSLTVTLKDNNDYVIGVLQLLNALDEYGAIVSFDDYDRLVVESLASQAAIALNNSLLLQRQQRMVKIENDIQIARRIQSDFLPRTMPEVPGWEIDARFQPAREVAGDFYDTFMMMNNRKVGFIIADVCDKGVGAALFMSLTRSLMRAFALQSHNINWADTLFMEESMSPRSQSGRLAIAANALRTAMVNTNNYITEHHLDLNMFATLFFGMIDPGTGSLFYINGGHCAPMLITPDGVIKERLNPSGPAVGMFPDMEFNIMETQMEPGDILFSFTDGVTDVRNPVGKMFHEEGVIPLVQQPTRSAKELTDRVEDAVFDFMDNAVQFDDVTMLTLRRCPENER
ncbi:MAG: SpoIIE family protein phosphatase, partial [Chloroflexi bacterium]|nr:SpoIIE family protein phosphatase [Chloroflexota bacterium]